jgi:hypothetical protein
VVAADIESALLCRDVKCHQGDRNVDVEKHSALQAVHVVMPFDTTVVPACLVGEGQFLDQAVRCQKVQRAIDRAVGNPRVAAPARKSRLRSSGPATGVPHRGLPPAALCFGIVAPALHRLKVIMSLNNQSEWYHGGFDLASLKPRICTLHKTFVVALPYRRRDNGI